MRCAISCDLLPPWSCDRISIKLQLTGKSRSIFQLSGMMRSHSSLNSSVRKSSGMLKTPDSIATVRLCHVPVIALLAFDSCVIPSSRMNSALVFFSNKIEYSSWTSCLLRTMHNMVSEPAWTSLQSQHPTAYQQTRSFYSNDAGQLPLNTLITWITRLLTSVFPYQSHDAQTRQAHPGCPTCPHSRITNNQ